MRIGILTIFNGNHNYGGMLQAYALNKALTEMGEEVYTLNYEYGPNPLYPTLLSRCKQYSLKQIIEKYLETRVEKKKYLIADKMKMRHQLFIDFSVNNIPQTDRYDDYNDIGKDYDALIVGSDQIWNPNMMRKPLILDIPTKARKIAYAASIGRGALSEYERAYMFSRIKDFHCVGVREDSLRKILEEGGITAKTVLDPTMLLTKDNWDKMAAKRMIQEPYVFMYSFSDCYLKRELEKFWKAKGKRVVYIPYVKQVYNEFDCKDTMEPIFDAGPVEFLSLIKYADHVYTDSFHGTVFSIIFNRQFTVYERSHKKSKVSMNSRIYDLLSTFGLQERLTRLDYITDDVAINYVSVNNKLAELRNESLNWLKKSIK